MESLKRDVDLLVNEFISSADKIYQSSTKEFNDDKFDSLKKSIYEEIEKLSNQQKRFKNLDWETLNIAFFGETNAGKSTLLEALIKGDGRTIGTGQKDFTKTIRNFSFGEKINLLDMPGIEGDEKKVKNEIWKAVNKAHIIFYVFPHSKEPERNTLKKIRKYLNKNTYVYGLINLRGILPKEALGNLLNGEVKIVEERTRKHLKEHLGDAFKDIFIVHSLYAFFARAKDIPDELKSKYKGALKYYLSKEELEKISNIRIIEEIIRKENQKKELIIPWDNTKKILNSQENIIKNVLRFKKEFDKAKSSLKKEINILRRNIEKNRKVTEKNIDKIINSKIYELESKMKIFLNEAIDYEYSAQSIKDEIKYLTNNYVKEIEKDIEKEIQDFTIKTKKSMNVTREKINYISSLFSKLSDKRKGDNINIGNVNSNIKVSGILNKLELKTEEILVEIGDVIFSTIGTIISFLINPILGAAVGLVNLFRKLFEWFVDKPGRKKAEAKRKAQKEVKNAVNKIKKDVKKQMEKEIEQLNRNFNTTLNEFKKLNKEYNELSIFIQKIIDQLKYVNYKTSESFLKHLDKNVKFGYIQVSLKEGVQVLVVSETYGELAEKLEAIGINSNNVYAFYDEYDLNNFFEVESKDSEFLKRAKDIYFYFKEEKNEL